MIYIGGISIAVFIEFLLIGKKNKSESDKILIMWMFLIITHLFLFYMQFSGEFLNYPFLLGLEIPLPFLYGVFLYLYVGSITNQLPPNRNLILLHFVPFLLSAIYLMLFFYFLPAAEKVRTYEREGINYDAFLRINFYALAVSGFVYVAWSILILKKHRDKLVERFADLEKTSLQWLWILTWSLGIIWVLVVFTEDTIIFGGAVGLVLLIGFFGLRQAEIYQPVASTAMKRPREKYSKSGLGEEQSEKLHRDLNHLMTVEAMYKEKDISIAELASRLEVHPNYLSQVINEKENKNFYDFINDYRIEEFKQLIAEPKNQHLTLLSLAYDCGFNSKSSFNRYFKKAMGQTPSQYYASLARN